MLRFHCAVVCGLLSLAAARAWPEDEKQPEPEARGLRVNDAEAFQGYTLITPLHSHIVFLLDMNGEVVHQWQTDISPGNSVYLRDNGNLLRAERVEGNHVLSGGGEGGKVSEYTWDGEKLWEFTWSDDKKRHHHDIEPLPNGNVLLIAWERMSGDRAREAGRDPALMQSGEIWPDYVFEVQPELPGGGKVVWEWHVWDHLIQDHDQDQRNFGEVAAHAELVDINADRVLPKPTPAARDAEEKRMRELGYLGGAPAGGAPAGGPPGGAGGGRGPARGADWLHTNGIDYNPALDQIVLSIRSLSEIWVIDHSTTTAEAKGHSGGRQGRGGDLLYRWGNPQMYRAGTADDVQLFHQHDAQWIEPGLPGAGNFLLFNNGSGRPGGEFSTILEIASPADAQGRYPAADGKALPPAQPVWSYGAGEGQKFYSSFISGAQRLRNGNTLICSGADGRVFEVTRDGRIVWDLLSPYGGDAPMTGPGALGPGGPPGGGPPAAAGPGGRGPDGPGGAGDGRRGPPGMAKQALFRATRLAPDHPGLARLKS